MSSSQTRFQKGRSGNPKGRPKGSRNKLTHKFLADIEKDWKKYGREVLDNVRVDHPEIYLKIVAGLILKDNPEDKPEDKPEQDHVTVEDARQKLFDLLQRRYPSEVGASACSNDDANA